MKIKYGFLPLIVALSACELTQQATRNKTLVLIGDSILAEYPDPYMTSVASRLSYTNNASLAVPAEGIDAQITRWNNSVYPYSGSVDFVWVQCGVNDLASSRSSAFLMQRYGSFIGSVAVTNPNAIVIIAMPLPARSVLSGQKYTEFLALRATIGGLVTRFQRNVVVVTGLSDELNDGNGYLLHGLLDGVHTDNAGRNINAQWIDDTLRINGATQ